jgi:hypothetical protein
MPLHLTRNTPTMSSWPSVRVASRLSGPGDRRPEHENNGQQSMHGRRLHAPLNAEPFRKATTRRAGP